ncbi:thiamine-phosphate kinase [Neptunicella marina]|uniref:Thiamine-monophosphate kinase n=1 Tax=Neptunicella marina TaxID=2125989 RepID=A0A8J6IQB9_9ALTE|nr:thiamine-phosphate kinase [Neptunicella marina]
MKEFSIIDNYFKKRSYQRKDVLIGIGDDCAVSSVAAGQQLAVTTDTLVKGVHFPEDAAAQAIAHKAVAVNLSDLAAMGAEPAWINLSLSVPEVDENWLDAFSQGMRELCEYYSVQLIGGDTVQGPLSVTITAMGFIPENQALTRSGAKPGDLLYVTGTLGDAALGLDVALNRAEVPYQHRDYLTNRLHFPTPRVLAGTTLRRIATACIDISDGTLAELGHLLRMSQCGALLHVEKLPLSPAMMESTTPEKALDYALAGGDDYELLFCVPEELKGTLDRALLHSNVPITCIGQMTGQAQKLEMQLNKQPFQYERKGFEHFSG